jgi:hypothetical protein
MVRSRECANESYSYKNTQAFEPHHLALVPSTREVVP